MNANSPTSDEEVEGLSGVPALRPYQPRLAEALARYHQGSSATAATVAGGAAGGLVAALAIQGAVAVLSAATLGLAAGLGAIAGALLVAHLMRQQ